MRERSTALDAVRVLGVAAIVIGHVVADDSVLRVALHPWHVAIFFVISGYLWKHGRTWGDEFRRRTRTLALPYLFWLVAIAVPYIALSPSLGTRTLSQASVYVLGGSNLGRPFSAFWFVGALYVACLLLRAIEPLPRAVSWALGIVGTLALIAEPRISLLPHGIGLSLVGVLFILAGQELASVRASIRNPASWGLVALVVGGAPFAVRLFQPLDVKAGDLGTPIGSVVAAAILCAGLILVAEDVAPRLPRAAQRGIVELASAGLVVILVHAAVIWVLLASLDPGPVPAVAIVLLTSWSIGLLIVRTPLAPFAAGRHQRRPHTSDHDHKVGVEGA